MTSPTRRRGPRPSRLAAIALLVLPILEILVIVAVGEAIGAWPTFLLLVSPAGLGGVGEAIGAWPTFLLLVVAAVLGVWLIRRQGGRAWRALNQAVQSGRMPARELADGVVVLVGGTLLLVPGFITDVLGLLLVLPFTRPVARSLLASAISKRMIMVPNACGGATVDNRPEGET